MQQRGRERAGDSCHVVAVHGATESRVVQWFAAPFVNPVYSRRPVAGDNAGQRVAPVVQRVAPVVQRVASVAREWTPVVREWTPVVREWTPVAREWTPVAREWTPVAREWTPVAREWTPVAREWTPRGQRVADSALMGICSLVSMSRSCWAGRPSVVRRSEEHT